MGWRKWTILPVDGDLARCSAAQDPSFASPASTFVSMRQPEPEHHP
jgi:hypothetical protein